MGDMADDYDGWDITHFELKKLPKEQREEQTWIKRDGKKILVKNMDNNHLFNSYMISGADYLFKEIVYRLFEEKLL